LQLQLTTEKGNDVSENQEVVLPEPDSPEWYQQQPGETEQAFYARINARSELESYWRDNREYSEVISEVMRSYRADEDGTRLDEREVTKQVASWIYDQREQAADEKEEELKGDPEGSAGEVAASEGWWAKEATAAADEEDEY
jgi:hypothetical protein